LIGAHERQLQHADDRYDRHSVMISTSSWEQRQCRS
jgi:hypothetical protein